MSRRYPHNYKNRPGIADVMGDHLEWRYTKDEEEALKYLYEKGAPLSEIVDKMQRDTSEVLVLMGQMIKDQKIKPTRKLVLI